MDVDSYAILFAAAAWFISLLVAILVVPRLAANRICNQFGLTRVDVNGQMIYAVKDLEGNPIKIPVGLKENSDGEKEPVMGFAGLPMTLTYLAAEQAALKVKMTLFNAKSQISKKMQQAAMGEAAAGGDLGAMFPFLPKKAQAAIAVLKAAGVNLGGLAQAGQGPAAAKSHSQGGQL